MFKRTVVMICLAVGVTACNKKSVDPNDPQNRLNAYISQSFSIKDAKARNNLLTYLTGDARLRLAAWSDDQFHEAFVDTKREFVKLLFRERKDISPEEVAITYELTYLDKNKGKNAKVTHRKLCTMVLENGNWMISSVKNLKELIEYQNEMSLP